MTKRRWTGTAPAAAILAAAIAGAAFPAFTQEMLLRSDLPLWTEVDQNVWPHSFAEDGEFGCVSRLRTGVWKQADANDPDTATSVLIRNRGVFHCALGVATSAATPPRWGESETSLLIVLGKTHTPSGEVDLYALQGGFRGGSTYLLLASARTKDLLDRFTILNPECPAEWTRKSSKLSVWVTEYCAVPDEVGLRRIAKSAAGRPTAGTLEYVGPEPDAP